MLIALLLAGTILALVKGEKLKLMTLITVITTLCCTGLAEISPSVVAARSVKWGTGWSSYALHQEWYIHGNSLQILEVEQLHLCVGFQQLV